MPEERPGDRVLPRARHPWHLVALAGAGLFLLGALAFTLRPGVLDAADAPLAGAGGQAGFLLANAFGFVGNIELLGVALVVSCVLLARAGRPAAAFALIAIFLVEEAAVQSLKELVARPRPEWAATAASGWSFPSGHAARGALVAAMAVAFVPTARKRLLVGLAVAFGLLMAAARVVLGVHHVSDVVAGAGLGLATAGLGMGLLVALEARQRSVRVPVEEPVASAPAQEAAPEPPLR